MLRQHDEKNYLIPFIQTNLIKIFNSSTQIIQFQSQNDVSTQILFQGKLGQPQITCSSKLMNNPLKEPSAHPDMIPVLSNIFPSHKK